MDHDGLAGRRRAWSLHRRRVADIGDEEARLRGVVREVDRAGAGAAPRLDHDGVVERVEVGVWKHGRRRGQPEARQQQVGLVLVVGRARDVARGDERGQAAFLAGAREQLDVEVGQRQHGADFVLFAELAQRPQVTRVIDERDGCADVRGVLRGRERRGVDGDGAGQAGEAGDDVVALADAGQEDCGRAHGSPSQPPAAPL